MRQPRVRRIAALCAMVAVILVPNAQAASGAGNAALDSHIIGDPLPGGEAFPQAELSAVAARFQGIESTFTAGSHATTVVATEGWHIPNVSHSELIIALVAVADPDLSSASTNSQAILAAKVAASTFCQGATGDPPVTHVPVSTIPNSHFVLCKPAPAGFTPMAIATSRANVIALIFASQTTVDEAQLSAIALRQYDELPTNEVSTAGKSDTSLVVGVILGSVVLVLCVALIVIVVRRRKKAHSTTSSPFPWETAVEQPIRGPEDAASSAVTPPPGWYPDPSRAGGRRYWTGSQWGPSESMVEGENQETTIGRESSQSSAASIPETPTIDASDTEPSGS